MSKPTTEGSPPTGTGSHYDGSAEEVRALGSFVKLLRAARWASIKAGRRREESGLSEGQFGVLEAVYHLGPLDQTELAHKVLSSPSNLTVVIDNLERQGYVERRRDARDRRRQVVHLRPSARRLLDELLPRHVERIVEVMSALSPEEQDRLGALCRKLGRAAERLE
ncbi:MAG: MarR family transcriptional regulator [Thermoanaerobaculia bacterium]|nr:MarR family transcriptional regulator [Thermoanaerobaculia bacterium]